MIQLNKLKKERHGPCDIFSYKGLKALQVYGVEKAFSELAKYKNFSMIIELGADYGGLTNMLADHEISTDAVIHTFDINAKKFTNLNPRKIVFHNIDMYKEKSEVILLLNGNTWGYTLLLCDGGNKAFEWEEFSQYLKTGDIIMAHDYAPNKSEHKENIEAGRWNWWEFNDENIKEDNLIKPLDCFDEYAWCIRERV